MKDWLNKPFPFIQTSKKQIIVSLLFASFVYLFLLTFQPFGMSECKLCKSLYIAGFFVITLVVMLVSFLILPSLFKQAFKTENWTVEKNIYFFLFQMTIIAVLNWLYDSTFRGAIEKDQYDFLEFLLMTLAIGIFPLVFLTLYSEKYFSNKHKRTAQELNTRLHQSLEEEELQIKILADNGKDVIELELKQFICIRSEGNYADVFFIENEELKKKLIRNSLTKIAQQLMSFETVKRCHRSYIVNLQNVNTVSGNARNYNFHVEKLNFAIPVSRSFPKSIIENIK